MKVCNHTWLASSPQLRTRLPLRPNAVSRRWISRSAAVQVNAFRRDDFDRFAQRVKSGEAWKDAWRTANDGFEQLVFEARKTAERIDRQYSVSRRVGSVASTAADRAREIDREFEISMRWRVFSVDFSRNWPKYRKQLNEFMATPLGKSFTTIFFIWFALSGWMFRILIFATWVLPIAGPLLVGVVANNFVIKGECPACQRQFIGYKNQMIRCAGCGNTVWQPKGDDFSSRGGNSKDGFKKSKSQIIDVEFEEK